MPSIFLNFRNFDGDWAALAIRNTLAERFGAGEVFLSSFSIPLAARFEDVLLQQARSCDVLLAIIGPRWHVVPASDGRPRLGAHGDWVCREIAAALTAGRRVVPVLLGATARLAEHDLPAEIAELAGLQGFRLDRAQYEANIRGLAESLMAVIPGLTPKPQTAPQQGRNVEVHVGDSAGEVTGVSRPAGTCPSASAAVWVDRGEAGSRTWGEYVRDNPGSGGADSELDA